MMEILAAGSIYLGDAITHASERALIAHLVAAMDRAGTPYVVIANCHFSGRQIDCILATGQSVVVIEAKASHWPVRGDINGHWARLQPNGGEVTYRNAYSQALDARYALRDAMSAGGSLGSWHPDASVVFTTGIPPGSRLTAGDDKVWIGALADLDLGITAKGSPWPLERWHAFARHHRLIAVSYDQAIAPPGLIESFRLLDEFRNAVRCEYMRDGRRWIAESDEAHDALIGAVLAVPGMYLAGPSGCGKTLFARRAAAELAANGTTVMYLSARLYDGSWQTLVRRELSLLTGVSPDILYRAVRRTGAPVAIILDGLNELPDADDALRGLRALAKRLDAGLFVTGQADAPPQLAALERVAIGRPSFALKKRIAATGENFSDVGLEALKAVTSGYEAAVIGSIAATVEHNPSRQGLLDLYVRERLGAHARLGALGLRRLAADLHSALAFSVSESGFDEAMFALNIPDDACTALFTADLLVRRAGRVSFAHELLQHACAAHGLEISVSRDPATWAILLGAPIYEDIAGDVLSVVESGNVATAILAGSRRPALLHAAMLGSHGAIAQAAAVALTNAAYQAAFAEIADLSLSVVENERTRITWNPDSLRNWTDEEKARLIAAGLDLNSDHGVERHMALYRAMDARLYDERLRVFDEAKAAGCHRLRSAAFELAYLGFGSETGVLHYSRAVRHGADESDRPIPAREFDVSRLSSGQLHFYLEGRYSLVPESGREAFAEQLIYCLEHRFAMEPYHVKLAILNAAGFARTASDEVTERLIGAVQALEVAPGNLGIGSAVTDALQFLGALEDPDDEYRRHVRSDIAFATHGVAEIERCERALMLTGAQFDHPYGEIYYDEIEKLPEETRRTLYRRAVAADTKYCGNLAWIVRQIVAWNDVNDTARMQRLAHLPDPASFMPQEEWSAFVDAVRFLGRHGIALDSVSAETDAGRCLALVRNLVHAAEDRTNGASHATTAWLELRTMPVGHAIGALGEVQRALSESHWSERFNPIQHLNLMTSYRQESLFLARAFLDAHAEAVYSHRSVFHDVGPQFAFNAIALLGDRSDLGRLRAHSLGPHAHSALATLKRLDQVAI